MDMATRVSSCTTAPITKVGGSSKSNEDNSSVNARMRLRCKLSKVLNVVAPTGQLDEQSER